MAPDRNRMYTSGTLHQTANRGGKSMWTHQLLGRVLASAAFCGIASSIVASAQTITGEISGTITDPSGAVVPQATVELVREGTSATRTGTTNQSGIFVFAGAPSGHLHIEGKRGRVSRLRANRHRSHRERPGLRRANRTSSRRDRGNSDGVSRRLHRFRPKASRRVRG